MMKLSANQLRKVSDICVGVGHVAAGSIVVPFLVNEFQVWIAITGVIFACGTWVASVYLVRIADSLYDPIY